METYLVGEATVKTNDSANLTSPPLSNRGTFYPQWIQINDEATEHFVVNDVKVGKNSQVANAACFPAALFGKSEHHDSCFLDRMTPGLNISLNVTNVGPSTKTIRCYVLGTWKQPRGPHRCIIAFGRKIFAENQIKLIAQSQLEIRPTRLYIPSTIFSLLYVDGLTTGPYLDLPSGHSSVPPERLQRRADALEEITFSPDPVVNVSAPITLSLSRLSEHRFSVSAALICDLVKT